MADNNPQVTRYLIADLVLDVQRGTLQQDQTLLNLPKLSYDLLVTLAAAAPALVSQQALMQAVWGDRVVGDETLKQRVKLIRKVLGEDAQSPRYIEAVRGRGYRLIPQVQRECVVHRPPSVMLDLSANDRFPSITNQQMSVWHGVSKLTLLLLTLMVMIFVIGSWWHEEEKTIPRLLVLPVQTEHSVNWQSDIDQLTSQLHLQLSRSGRFQLVSPSAVAHAQQQNLTEPLGTFLDADLSLEFRVVESDNTLSVNWMLNDVTKQALLWNQVVDMPLTSTLSFPEHITDSVINTLQAYPDLSSKALGHSQNSQAQALFWRGKSYYQRYRQQDNQVAIDFFKRAINLDPTFASAHAALSQAHSQQHFQFGGSREDKQQAIESAYQAIMLDNSMAYGYQALGTAYYVSGWLTKSISAHEKALAIDHTNLETLSNLGFIHSEQGNLLTALKWSEQALKRDPQHVVSMVHAGQSLQRLGRFKLAEAWFNKALSIQPDYFLAYFHLALLHLQQEQPENANAVLLNAEQDYANQPTLMRARAYLSLYSGASSLAREHFVNLAEQAPGKQATEAGIQALLLTQADDPEKWQAYTGHYQQLLLQGSDDPEHSYILALLLAKRGEENEAMRYLVQSVEQGFRSQFQLERHPALKELSGLPGFQQLLRQITTAQLTQNSKAEMQLRFWRRS